MLYAIGVLIFAFGLLASIALHEVGHLVPAKRFGVRVTQYMVGFGPTIFSRRRGDTEYGLKAIPLGGYIRMIGMVPPGASGRRSRWPRRLAELVEEFRATSRAEVREQDEDRQFYRLTPGKKMIIMLGGPTMNLLIFLVLTLILCLAIGGPQQTNTVATVSQCVVPASVQATACPAEGSPGYVKAPANGVLHPGDRLLAIDGQRLTNWTQSVDIIQASAGKKLTLTVERGGRQLTLDITPALTTRFTDDTETTTKQAGFIGVSTTTVYRALSVHQTGDVIWNQLGLSVHALQQFPSKISSLVGTVFENKPRDKQGAVGVVGLGRIGGEIAQSHGFTVREKLASLLSLLAGVNLLLFFFNLLPLLPLDGGHVAGALVEAIRRGFARLRRRPRQIFVDVAQLVPVMYVVASILIVFSVLVMYADIVKPISLN